MSEPAAVAETHVATIFFAGSRAYKLKKPVRFDFLDFSTRELRRAALRRELELNRRFSPEVYLDVVDLVGSDGAPVDHMLVMERMPAGRALAALCEGSEDLEPCITAIARKVASVHASADTSPEIESAATPNAIRTMWSAGLAEMRDTAGNVHDLQLLDQIESLALSYVDGRAPLFTQRIGGGHIRDGHGDLLAADIFCVDSGPAILDCIEFNDRLRYGDVIGDVAFLAMDLERLHRRDLAKVLFERYHEFSGETAPQSLVDHYIAYRASVRAKVAGLRFAQGHAESALEAHELADICLGHLRAARIRLVAVGGRPGTGKSTLAAAMSDRLGWPVLRSDVVRKQLAGVAPESSGAAGVGEGIYSEIWTDRTYSTLIEQAERMAGLGEPVILDATWRSERERDELARAARRACADLVEIECRCSEEVAIARLTRRQRESTDASDAGPEIGEALEFDNWPAAIAVDTGDDLETALRCALSAVSN